jgi:signal peptidase I
MVFRLLTVVTFYLIPYGSAISDSLIALANLLIPIGLYLFIDSLYEKKKKYALGNTNRWARYASRALSALVILIMLGTVMLVSNHFRYGALVIATESMTGELNRGDGVFYEEYTDQPIATDDILIFHKGGQLTVHRVTDITRIDGQTRYVTEGDANEDVDFGYITDEDIVGISKAKIPYFGYLTLWARDLFHQ